MKDQIHNFTLSNFPGFGVIMATKSITPLEDMAFLSVTDGENLRYSLNFGSSATILKVMMVFPRDVSSRG